MLTTLPDLLHNPSAYELSGTWGRNRADEAASQINARDDYQAINQWLALYEDRPQTLRSYRKEAERLLLWAVIEQTCAFSDLTTSDLAAYERFLLDPQPASRWVSKRRVPRTHPKWRPFVANAHGQAGLSRDSVRLARAILNRLFTWLVDQGYLKTNPLSGLPATRKNTQIQTARSFSMDQWAFIFHYVKSLPNDEKSERLRFILHFAYSTGLRLAEMVNATTGDIQNPRLTDELRNARHLHVVGKGERERTVPLPKSLLAALNNYLLIRNLPADPALCPASTPLISRLNNSKKALSTSVLHRTIKALFNDVANHVPNEMVQRLNPDQIRQASAHWLRHTHGAHSVANNISLPTIQANLGHASLATTSLYVRSAEEQRHKEMQKLDQSLNELGKSL